MTINSRIVLPFCIGLSLIGCQPHHPPKPISHLATNNYESKEKLLDYYIQQKMPDKIIQLTENTQDLQLLNYRGVAFDLMGKHSEAQNVYKIILMSDAKKAPTLNNLALSYFLEGKSKDAEKVLKSCPHCINLEIFINLKKDKLNNKPS